MIIELKKLIVEAEKRNINTVPVLIDYLKDLQQKIDQLEREVKQLHKDKSFYSNQWGLVSKENKELKSRK